ncbi:hypothetical protein GXM_03625 [Nostoc sphaeroides CCNUC1]|uniref:Uncharacterized protein n=1 Tax=Nostoc sphaeroides CCNUC1 TaxID=2653204 RepID=A0A5P8W097_9NOSO|nr:hypothetical protein GXM_03625 [Nostoc sphaeroides CCNUC1]
MRGKKGIIEQVSPYFFPMPNSINPKLANPDFFLIAEYYF